MNLGHWTPKEVTQLSQALLTHNQIEYDQLEKAVPTRTRR